MYIFLKELDYRGPEVHGIYFRLLEEAGNFGRLYRFYARLKTGSFIA